MFNGLRVSKFVSLIIFIAHLKWEINFVARESLQRIESPFKGLNRLSYKKKPH